MSKRLDFFETVKLSKFVGENKADLEGRPWKDVFELCEKHSGVKGITLPNVKGAFRNANVPYPSEVKRAPKETSASQEPVTFEHIQILARGIATLQERIHGKVDKGLLALACSAKAVEPVLPFEKKSA